MPERLPKPNSHSQKPERQKEDDVPRPLFAGGWVLATPEALQVLAEAEMAPLDLLSRHLVGDWGHIGGEEKLLNDMAVVHGQRLTSAYQVGGGREIWVVTAADRETTWLKLPHEADPERYEG